MPPRPRRPAPSVAAGWWEAGPETALTPAVACSRARGSASTSPALSATVLPGGPASRRWSIPHLEPDGAPRRVPTPLLIALNGGIPSHRPGQTPPVEAGRASALAWRDQRGPEARLLHSMCKGAAAATRRPTDPFRRQAARCAHRLVTCGTCVRPSRVGRC